MSMNGPDGKGALGGLLCACRCHLQITFGWSALLFRITDTFLVGAGPIASPLGT